MKKKPPLVEVVWIDAIDRDETCKLGEQANYKYTGLYTRHTVGYLVRQDAEVVSLAHEYDPPEADDDHDGTIGKFLNIPAGWVQSITYKARKPRRKAKKDEAPATKTVQE